MRYLVYSLVLLLVACGGPSNKMENPARDSKTLVYSDEFDELSSEWVQHFPNRARKLGYNNPDNASVGESLLQLKANVVDGVINMPMLRTETMFKYGYFEALVKFPTTAGLQSAFWLASPNFGQGDTDSEVFGTEIDIEHISRNSKVYNTIHWDGYGKNTKSASSNTTIDSFEWQLVGVEWTDKGYYFYIDNELVNTIETGISKTEQFMLLSLEVSEWSACDSKLLEIADPSSPVRLDEIKCSSGGLTGSDFTDYFLVDYVNVYQ